MRRLLPILAIAAVFALVVAGWAQLPMHPVPLGRPGLGANYTGAGDIVPGALAYYGVRAYTAAYAQPGTNVGATLTRSTDNQTCQLVITPTGNISTITSGCSIPAQNGSVASTWCAAGAGNCYATNFTDQTGNGYNDGGSIAYVFNCLGSIPCVSPGGNGTSTVTIASTSLPVSFSTVANNTRVGNHGGTPIALWNGASNKPYLIFGLNSANNVVLYAGTQLTATANDGSNHAIQGALPTNGTGTINVDGTETSGATGTGAASTTLNITTLGGANDNAMSGHFFEAGVWTTAFTSGQRTSLCQNQQAYYGTANFPANC